MWLYVGEHGPAFEARVHVERRDECWVGHYCLCRVPDILWWMFLCRKRTEMRAVLCETLPANGEDGFRMEMLEGGRPEATWAVAMVHAG